MLDKSICHFRGVGLFCTLILFLMENPVSKQCRPSSEATLCGIQSGSALIAYDPFTGWGGRVVQRCWVNFQWRGVLLIWIIVGQGPIVLAVGAGGGCLDIFPLISFSHSLRDGPI